MESGCKDDNYAYVREQISTFSYQKLWRLRKLHVCRRTNDKYLHYNHVLQGYFNNLGRI